MHVPDELQRVIGSPTSPRPLKDTEIHAALVEPQIGAIWQWTQAGNGSQKVESSPGSPHLVLQASEVVSKHRPVILTVAGEEVSGSDKSSELFLHGSREIQSQHKSPIPLTCAFGFTGKFDTPPILASRTRQAFLEAINSEHASIIELYQGFKAYQDAITYYGNNAFSTRFLERETTAVQTTLCQLTGLANFITDTRAEIEAKDDNLIVERDMLAAFRHIQEFVARVRAILVHCHVFYKINFVLVAKKVH
ncbi:hypothetical protein LTR84_009456 [Exophiala bonariae]|uniref:Uncharacterized protein n=1 Tax=Exophiala bonariae TaxID=1690606 RepID=A0AAV9MW19_9EURO|nr:hypothetical protein LTR84_009456 [Exophiala bonariae]